MPLKVKKQLRKTYWLCKHFGFKPLVYSAGMPRSGSTLLFNILRLLLIEKYGQNLSYAWKDEVNEMEKGDIYLIKTHSLDKLDIWRAQRTFYSFRDVRDVMISRWRMFDKEPEIGIAGYYIRQDVFAKSKADLVFKYEDFTKDVENTITQIAEKLNVEVVPQVIIDQLPDPTNTKKSNEGHHNETLLHKNHVTGTLQGEWQQLLPADFLKKLHTEYEWWFQENGYEI